MSTAILDRSRHDIGTGFPPPGDPADPGRRDECGFPGSTEAEGMCREIPVATISETCPNGHMEMLRACAGHASEVEGWESFIGEEGSPGVLTCPQCHDAGSRGVALQVSLFWDDMRAEILQ
jgi:hypothetical protein